MVTTRYIFLGQIGFLVFLLICLILSPHYLFESNEGGISNFGVHSLTAIPYTLAFCTAGFYTLKAARALAGYSDRLRKLQMSLTLLGALYLATLLSTYPYKIGPGFDTAHQAIGGVFVVYCLSLGGWLVVKIRRDLINFTAYAVQLAGFVLAVFNFFDIFHLLFIAEALTALGFSVVLVRSSVVLTTVRPARSRKEKLY